MTRILIINGNPKQASFCGSLAGRFHHDAELEGHDLRRVELANLHFDNDLSDGYDDDKDLEAAVSEFQDAITWAEHIVVISPVWWGSMPSKLKGLIDRSFLPGFAFAYEKGKAIPEKLLKGKSAELIFTLDTPVWWYKLWQGNPIYKELKHAILEFSGIRVKRASYFGPIIKSNESKRIKWLEKASRLGAKPAVS